MPTDDALYSRFGKLSDQALRTLLSSEESDGLTSVQFRALTEELVRRGLRKSTAPTVPIEKAAAEGGIHPKASLARRFIAGGIDAAIVIVSFVVMWWIVIIAAIANHESVGGVIVLVIFVGTLSYMFLRDARRGQSLGKRAARLVVVSVTTGRPCSARDSAFRSLVLVLTGILIPGVGWLIEPIVALVDKDGRRLGDRAADTQVIEVSSYNAA